MDALLSATQPCFGAISQIRHLDPNSLASPEELQRRLCAFVDDMRASLGAAGLNPQDVQDVTYAVVALADEVALSAGEPLASHWMTNLLQFRYFHENTAGDGFFTRLEQLRRDSRRRDALRAYTLCLLFGFQGKYRIRGGELELLTLIESLQREAFPSSGPGEEGEPLSPHGQRPTEALGGGRRSAPLIIAAAAAVLVALLLYTGERIYLGHGFSQLDADVAAAGRP